MNCNRYLQIGIDISERQLLRLTVSDTTAVCNYCFRGHSHIEYSHSLCQNDTKVQNQPPSTFNIKMPDLPKIDVYNCKYIISVGNLFFVSHKCINK